MRLFRLHRPKPYSGTFNEVILILHGLQTQLGYYRYGPTPDNPTNHWYDFSYDGSTGYKNVPGPNQILVYLYFQDGGRGDDYLIADGVIVDLGGPATSGYPGGAGSGGGSCFISTGN